MFKIYLILVLQILSITSISHKGNYDWNWNCECQQSNANGECLKFHCDAKRDTSVQCFSTLSSVLTIDGKKKQIKDLKINEEILTYSTEKSQMVSDRFLGFIHIDHEKSTKFLSITTENVKNFLISSEHLLFFYDHEKNLIQNKRAKNINVGDFLIVNSDNKYEKILQIEETTQKGFVAPLTNSGTLMVDGVFSSNYAYVNDHDLAHKFFAPYRFVMKYLPTSISENLDIRNQNGIHWYANALSVLRKFTDYDE